MDIALFKQSMHCTCPKCGKGRLYQDGLLNLKLRDTCDSCGLDLAKNDSGDGPAVFLIFILGALLVPMALIFDAAFEPPLWVHPVLWGSIAVGITVGTLKPLKSYIIALQFRHRASEWDK